MKVKDSEQNETAITLYTRQGKDRKKQYRTGQKQNKMIQDKAKRDKTKRKDLYKARQD